MRNAGGHPSLYVLIVLVLAASYQRELGPVFLIHGTKVDYIRFLHWVLCQKEGEIREYAFGSWLSTPEEGSIIMALITKYSLANNAVPQTSDYLGQMQLHHSGCEILT